MNTLTIIKKQIEKHLLFTMHNCYDILSWCQV